ncbi:YpdA family putative bacillithiol disulfide reductase [Formosa sediminum]|uniref:YpdA family putative bacillithiol disulfide reductase n=1 Tax=Formosa sediminum TaxID=2594004 RepID=A0A516GLQ2_9FLAO|nr:YpdA family putative bacillithiol disulfide reductase [Formosa sediminum]QDO92453.1 YpdA family putative bacillithiol disulfide reductase [Formosa sediminum]
MNIKKDVIIIGAGPIGIACAKACKETNLNYLVIEKGSLTNSIYNYPLNMTFFSTSEKLEIDGIPFISNNPKPNRNEALEYYRRVASSNQLDINLYEEANSIVKDGNVFNIQTNKENYTSKKVILATGFYDIPISLNVPGEDLPKVSHYYKEAHPYSMQNVVVVGASNSSVDAALEIYRKGGNVTMVIRGDAIGERVKYWVKPDIINRISEGSIAVHFKSEIEQIKDKAVIVNTPEGKLTIKNDYVLALTGYQPNIKLLEDAGITFSEDGKFIPDYNDETMETNIEGLFLAGVICGGMETHKWFIENSRVHAKKIIQHLTQVL